LTTSERYLWTIKKSIKIYKNIENKLKIKTKKNNYMEFDMPKNQSSYIKVFGLGGGGGNAVNYMHQLGITGANLYVCNTDEQALNRTNVANKIVLGAQTLQGLGAGANPEVGREAALESMEEIESWTRQRHRNRIGTRYRQSRYGQRNTYRCFSNPALWV
jgi:cell division GTPase FtsZ